jgi:hypothetical protein
MLRPILVAGLAAVAWSTLQAQARLTHVHLAVDASNPIWTETGITVSPGDIVVVHAEGAVRVGPYIAPVDANGATGLRDAGVLELKIGTHTPHRVGVVGCVFADYSGMVLLRVYDFRYEDNAGTFEVNVLHIPAQAIPAPHAVAIARDRSLPLAPPGPIEEEHAGQERRRLSWETAEHHGRVAADRDDHVISTEVGHRRRLPPACPIEHPRVIQRIAHGVDPTGQ